jgi:hypothetical protein
MIENKMGMSIYERDEDGGEEQDLASEQVKTALNTCGATALCLDLIVDGVDSDLQLECIRLIVGLLFLEGGNKPVQGVIHDYLNRPQGFLFFRQVESILEELSLWHSWQGDVELAEGVEPSLPDKILILRMLQLMSEGHYLPNQDLVREQPDSDESVNLLDSMVSYLKTQGQPDYIEGLLEGGTVDGGDLDLDGLGAAGGEKDPLYDQAVEIVLKNRKASISLVQRHLKIGYNRAARLVEDMEKAGLVSAMSTSGQREILVPSRAE